MGGKSSKTKVTQKLDPSQAALNNLAVQLAQEQAPYRSQALSGVIGPTLNPTTNIAPGALEGLNLAPSEKPYASMAYSSPYTAAAAGSLLSLTDPGKMQGAAMENFNKVVGPQLLASLTASGLGRSGAVGEATAKAGAQMALPIEQMREQNVANLANWSTGQQQSRLGIAQGLQTGSPVVGGGGTSTTQQSQPGFNLMGALGSGLTTLAGSDAGLGMLGSLGSSIWGGLSTMGAGLMALL